jgi:hypothetical protein
MSVPLAAGPRVELLQLKLVLFMLPTAFANMRGKVFRALGAYFLHDGLIEEVELAKLAMFFNTACKPSLSLCARNTFPRGLTCPHVLL